MVVGRANSADINVEQSDDDLESSEQVRTMLPPYYNNHGLLQASELSQQSHISLSHLSNSNHVTTGHHHNLHGVPHAHGVPPGPVGAHHRSSSQSSDHTHISINTKERNNGHHESRGGSSEADSEAESLTSNVQDEKDIITDQDCDIDTKDDVSSKEDNDKEVCTLFTWYFNS